MTNAMVAIIPPMAFPESLVAITGTTSFPTSPQLPHHHGQAEPHANGKAVLVEIEGGVVMGRGRFVRWGGARRGERARC